MGSNIAVHLHKPRRIEPDGDSFGYATDFTALTKPSA
jgi:hypothetical protein